MKNPQELKDLRACEGADPERRRAEFGRRLSDWSTWVPASLTAPVKTTGP